jgi:serine/threonine-protein kinase
MEPKNGKTRAPPEGAPTAGAHRLGRYRVVEEIGVGGMASVHLARLDGPGGFQKWAAIKRIHPHLVADESFVQMFLDEARIAARISHPNVATVFDLGRHGNTYWIAMEYLHGEPLREVMRRSGEVGGPVPPEIASRVIADAAEGLHSAHELLGSDGEKLNLIHRDVTPHNLFVTYDGATKVVDFGIAKCSSRISSTRAGTLKGKLAYMSPEQVQGETIDRRTDIFALGVVLWELTTGRRLFRVDSDLGTLAKVRECDVPRPSTIVQGYPIDLESVVMNALAKNPAERFATARELSRALQSLMTRRGLFIASEEVAGYVQFIFRERIRKREAHLRRAGNPAQTTHVEPRFGAPRNLAFSGTPSLHTYVSDAQAVPAPDDLRPAAGIPAISHPSSAPTVARYARGLRRTASAHGPTREVGEDPVDEADTLVTRRASADSSPSPCAPPPVRRTPSRHPRNPSRRVATPSGMPPVWAAAVISGALALLPAGGIFVALSRALRSSASVATDTSSTARSAARRALSPTPRDPAPSSMTAEAPAVQAEDRSPPQPAAGAEAGSPAAAAPDRASLAEDPDGCTVTSCIP